MTKIWHKKKSLGQHFLHDQYIIQKIIKAIMPQPIDHIIEIGPGAGVLTTKLLSTNSLDVIEVDQEIIPILEKNCDYAPNLHIHTQDVLKVDFTQFQAPMRIVGNLPYNISTPLLFHLIKNIGLTKDWHFMLQKEVADRIVATPGSKTYGRLSVMLQYYCETKILFQIGSGAFSPPPKVDSAFVRFLPRKYHIVTLDENKLSEIVRQAFSQRRKTITNSLKHYFTTKQLTTLGIDPKSRPEQLSVDKFVLLSNGYSNN